MKAILIVWSMVSLIFVVSVLIVLHKKRSYNIAIGYTWSGTLPRVSISHGRGWAYVTNRTTGTIDEMALSVGDLIMEAHPGEYKKGGAE